MPQSQSSQRAVVRSVTLSVSLLLTLASAVMVRAGDDLPAREERAMTKAVAHVAPSVVSIETVGGAERVEGMLVGSAPTTGLVVSADGYIVSSAFNFAQAPTSILVAIGDGRRFPARLVATDRSRMLVLLKIESDVPLAVPVAVPESELRVGQWAVAVGRTFEGGHANISVGIISALGRIWGKAVQTDAKISPANYGGPLIDLRGRVVGVLVPLAPDRTGEMAGVDWYDSGIGFAIPLEHIRKILPRLEQGKDLNPGLMGVTFAGSDIYDELPTLSGARPNSPAREAGLRKGDRIVAVDGHKVERLAQLYREIQAHYAGETIKLSIERGKESIERTLTLASKIDPYRRPTLGILPTRAASGELAAADKAKQPSGVGVRWVEPKGPAELAGVQAGDRILAIEGQAVADRQALADRVADSKIGSKVKLDVLRGDKKLVLDVELAEMTGEVPEQLPAAPAAPKAPEEERPPVGLVELEDAGMSKGILYVPENYDPAVAHGLLVWLHSGDGLDREKLLAEWRPWCAEHDCLLLAPQAALANQWTPPDVERVARAIERVRDTYTLDEWRVAACGTGSGGALAYALAFGEEHPLAAVAAIHARMPKEPTAQEPEQRLSFFVVSDKDPATQPSVKQLRAAKYPLVTRQADAGKPLDAKTLEALRRWLDALDRI
jgi:serine protease Do